MPCRSLERRVQTMQIDHTKLTKTCEGNLSNLGPEAQANNPTRAPVEGVSTEGFTDACPTIISARSRSQRMTDHVTLKQAQNMIFGMKHANHLGLLPNRFFTINWEQAGLPSAARPTGQFLKLFKDGLRARGASTSHIWVVEGGKKVGLHVHLLLYIPPERLRWFHRSRTRWLKKCGATVSKGVFKSVTIKGSAVKVPDEPLQALYFSNLSRVAIYLIKHCDPEVQQAFGVRSSGPCTLSGKRMSISQNIGPAARNLCEHCKPTP